MNQFRRRLARRTFLAAIGRSAGGAAMLRVMAAMGISSTLQGCGGSSASAAAPSPAPAPPPSNRPPSPRPGDWPAGIGAGRSVIVVGAGIAGMTTVLEMEKLGYRCTLLEARSEAGGRVRTIRAGDIIEETGSTQQCLFDNDPNLYFNAGPARIAHHHEFLLGYCREFSVPLETFVNDNRAARIHSGSDFGGAPQLARRIRSDLRGNIAALLATAINQNALDQELTAGDREAVLALLRTFGDLDTNYHYVGSMRAGFPGQERTGSRDRGELLSPIQLETLASDVLWANRESFTEDLDQQPVMLQPVGGMDRIARAFESRVLTSTVFDAVVTNLAKTPSGVRVQYQHMGAEQALEADYAVVCIPATVLAAIENEFSSAHRTEIAGFRYTSAVRVAFQSPRFWEQNHNLYGGISWTRQPIAQLWYPSHGFGDADGIVLGAYIFDGPDGDSFSAMTPQQRLDASTTQASALHTDFGQLASRGISVAWRNVPFQLGGWGVSVPGVLLEADENYVFAGEHLSQLQGWQEGAILSAYRAIDTIVARDSSA